MSIARSTLNIPADPLARRDWVVYQLRTRGSSLRQIAREIGVVHQAVSQTLVLPNSHIEPAIAKALGVSVRDLFPERFDSRGRRLHRTREKQRSTVYLTGNVQTARVA
jgi:Ner family transcriptional regulator